jgi:hypothetical protein
MVATVMETVEASYLDRGAVAQEPQPLSAA